LYINTTLQVQFSRLPLITSRGDALLAEAISLKAKGIDGEYTGNLGYRAGFGYPKQ
jgi:hypothetical protein